MNQPSSSVQRLPFYVCYLKSVTQIAKISTPQTTSNNGKKTSLMVRDGYPIPETTPTLSQEEVRTLCIGWIGWIGWILKLTSTSSTLW